MQVLRVSPVEPQPPRSHFLEPTLRLRGSSLSQGTLALDARSLLSPTVVSCCFTNVFVIKRRRRELPRVLGAFSSSKKHLKASKHVSPRSFVNSSPRAKQPTSWELPPSSQPACVVSCRVVLCCVVLLVCIVCAKETQHKPTTCGIPTACFFCLLPSCVFA